MAVYTIFSYLDIPLFYIKDIIKNKLLCENLSVDSEWNKEYL